MAPAFDQSFSDLLARCLRDDGTLVPYNQISLEADGSIGEMEITLTWHEVIYHLENYGARELSKANGMGERRDPPKHSPSISASGLSALGMRASAVDCDGKTALHHALINGYARPDKGYNVERAISHLLKLGADPNASDKAGVTPLQLAVALNLLPVIRILRQGGAIFRGAADEPDAAPAKEPAASRDAVRVFLALGGDLEAPCGGVMFNPSEPEPGSVRVGASAEAVPHRDFIVAWLEAARHDDQPLWQALCEVRGDTLEQHNSVTAWLDAARRGDLWLLQVLREAGVNVEACQITDEGSHTAIGMAATNRHFAALRQLCAWEVPMCSLDDGALRPLSACLKRYDREHDPVIRWFYQRDDPDWEPDGEANNALAECVALLLERGERPGPKDIVIACQTLRVLELLWPYAPLLDADDASEALNMVCEGLLNTHFTPTRAVFARAFLEQGAEFGYYEGNRCLRYALKYEDAELVELLRAAGARESRLDEAEPS